LIGGGVIILKLRAKHAAMVPSLQQDSLVTAGFLYCSAKRRFCLKCKKKTHEQKKFSSMNLFCRQQHLMWSFGSTSRTFRANKRQRQHLHYCLGRLKE